MDDDWEVEKVMEQDGSNQGSSVDLRFEEETAKNAMIACFFFSFLLIWGSLLQFYNNRSTCCNFTCNFIGIDYVTQMDLILVEASRWI